MMHICMHAIYAYIHICSLMWVNCDVEAEFEVENVQFLSLDQKIENGKKNYKKNS